MRPMILILALSGMAAGQGARTFSGVITDSECSTADHAHMRMGPTDAECVSACIGDHGAAYVLFDGKTTYALSNQKMPETFAARTVTITGTLDAKTRTIQVESIRPAK
jgi:type 1 fimbria pilin